MDILCKNIEQTIWFKICLCLLISWAICSSGQSTASCMPIANFLTLSNRQILSLLDREKKKNCKSHFVSKLTVNV